MSTGAVVPVARGVDRGRVVLAETGADEDGEGSGTEVDDDALARGATTIVVEVVLTMATLSGGPAVSTIAKSRSLRELHELTASTAAKPMVILLTSYYRQEISN